ncbi:glycosyltransferase [Nannocystis pusilla]|uniref:glycosyltransferase n=1 Tax=Nannocystis pusilla TaxID=889268 RepID=UPI003B835041
MSAERGQDVSRGTGEAAAFRPCALIPTFDNPRTVRDVVLRVKAHLPDVVVIDDGSGPEGRAAVEAIGAEGLAHVRRRPHNGGKGAAVKTGFQFAHELGYTHALQVDADGQHDLGDIPHSSPPRASGRRRSSSGRRYTTRRRRRGGSSPARSRCSGPTSRRGAGSSPTRCAASACTRWRPRWRSGAPATAWTSTSRSRSAWCGPGCR